MLPCTHANMSQEGEPRFSQVIDEDWSKSEHTMLFPCSSEEDKAVVFPPCIPPLLLQGSRAFQWLLL